MAESPMMDFLILANHVEAVNGLLYISGGGWTDQYRHVKEGNLPPSHFGIGVSLRVPWDETNKVHGLTVQVEDEDTAAVVVRGNVDIRIDQPTTLPPGTEVHTAVGVSVDTTFPHPGSYRVVARLGEQGDVKTWSFRIHDIPVKKVAL